jgi:integrase/recombinase XerC
MKTDVKLELIEEKTERLKSLPEIVKNFIQTIDTAEKSINTQIGYIKDLDTFFWFSSENLPPCKGKKVSDITLEDIQQIKENDIHAFLNFVTVYKKPTKTKNGDIKERMYTNGSDGKARKLATLKAFYRYLSKRDFITKNPTEHIEIDLKRKRAIKERLEGTEVEKYLETIEFDENINTSKEADYHERLKTRDMAMSLILAYTGVRISELVQLDIKDISIKKGAMLVTRKGGNQDVVYMPEPTLDYVSVYIDERVKVKVPNSLYKDALFLSSQKRRIDPKTVRYAINKYTERSGLDVHITPHVFRRTFGTEFYNQTKDMYLTANQLGHSSAETTRRFYAEPSEKRKRESMANFQYNLQPT